MQRWPERAGLSCRHRHERRHVHFRMARAGDRRGDRHVCQAGRIVAGGRLAALFGFIRPGTASWSPAARSEQKFWAVFTQAIGLPAELAYDFRNPRATRDAVAELIAARTAEQWRPLFAAADCCTTIVVSFEQELRDRISSRAVCSTTQSRAPRARACLHCRCRPRRSCARGGALRCAKDRKG